MSLNPITREEKFLAKAGGQDVGELKPITRKEKFLDKIAGGGGASSWEKLGETVEKTNTLEWDGTNSDIVVSQSPIEFHFISDVTPSHADIEGSKYVRVENNEETLDESALFTSQNAYMYAYYLAVAMCDNASVEVEGFIWTFPKKGTYFCKNTTNGRYIKRIMAPTALFDTTVITPIPTKYLPEHLQFGEEVIAEWNGVIGDKFALPLDSFGISGAYLVKVSDKTYTMEELQNCKVILSSGLTLSIPVSGISDISSMGMGKGLANSQMMFCCIHESEMLPSGTYLCHNLNGITVLALVGIIGQRLDNKFTNEMIVTVDGGYSTRTYEEIKEAVLSGRRVRCIMTTNDGYTYIADCTMITPTEAVFISTTVPTSGDNFNSSGFVAKVNIDGTASAVSGLSV